MLQSSQQEPNAQQSGDPRLQDTRFTRRLTANLIFQCYGLDNNQLHIDIPRPVAACPTLRL
jgi:hypothetical protein